MTRINYICEECGNKSLYWDATAYWDVEAQTFKMSDAGPNDTSFCGDCGAEHCAKTVDAGEPTETEEETH